MASRLVERYHRPVVLIALDGDSGRGSGRSIPAFDLHARARGVLGAPRAASAATARRPGSTSRARPVDAFRDAFVAHAASVLSPDDLMPEERVDAIVPGGSLGLGCARS